MLTHIILLFLTLFSRPALAQGTQLHWPMAGHDPLRSSRADEAVHILADAPDWHRTLPHYIPQESHLVTYPGTASRPGIVMASTSGGVYALDATNGSTFWFYQTDLPVGHSPTVVNDIAYIPVLDKTIHAVDIDTGNQVWQTAQAGAGFDTSPVVTNDMIYAGNRDGYVYAFSITDGTLAWYFKTEGRASYSPAYADGVIYTGCSDGYAYALDAQNGALIWKSVQFPGEGFYSYWPVIVGDYVIYSGSSAYLNIVNTFFAGNSKIDVLPDNNLPGGTLADPLGWHDAASISAYFNQHPQRRTVFVLNRSTGQEVTPYAPIIYKGNSASVRQPPAVGPDNTLYFNAPFRNNPNNHWLKGDVLAWRIGTNLIKPTDGGDSADELDAVSIIGHLVYWNHKEDQAGHTADLSTIDSGPLAEVSSWRLQDLTSWFPNYFQGWIDRKYGSVATNGYGTQGSNPPVPLGSKIFHHHSNAVMSFTP